MSSKTSRKKCLVIALVLLTCMGRDVNADFTFEEPTNLGPTVNSISADQSPSISADGLSLYFSDHAGAPFRTGGYGNADIWVTTRKTLDDPWGIPVNLGAIVNGLSMDESPSISAPLLTVIFSLSIALRTSFANSSSWDLALGRCIGSWDFLAGGAPRYLSSDAALGSS